MRTESVTPFSLSPTSKSALDNVIQGHFVRAGHVPSRLKSGKLSAAQRKVNNMSEASIRGKELVKSPELQSKLKISPTSYVDFSGSQVAFNSTLERKLPGAVVFDQYTKRPEFRNYAPEMEPHENRFMTMNLGTLASSKNLRARSIDFTRCLPRKGSLFKHSGTQRTGEFNTEEDKALAQQVKYPTSYLNDLVRDHKKFLKKRKD